MGNKGPLKIAKKNVKRAKKSIDKERKRQEKVGRARQAHTEEA